MTEARPKLLERSRPPFSLLYWEPEDIMKVLGERLERKGITEAYPFGSLATRNVGAWSDIDLIIVQESEAPFVERPGEYAELLELGVPVDVLVYTPEEFARLGTSASGFWKEVRKNTVRLI